MKRYRVWSSDFDTRAFFLGYQVPDHAEPAVKENWAQNKQHVARSLLAEYGQLDAAGKIERLLEIGSKPFSVVAFHNEFFGQVRDAFIIGATYPAATGACALGERILNHLVLRLRGDYQATDQFKRVARKESFDNWEVPISTLEAWDILLSDVADRFRDLASLRNRVVHFRPEVDRDARPLARDAIKLLNVIVERQFGTSGLQPWFIEGTHGAGYIKKTAERWPFVREIYLPNCLYVGPAYRLEHGENGSITVVDMAYEDIEISDKEFCTRMGLAQHWSSPWPRAG